MIRQLRDLFSSLRGGRPPAPDVPDICFLLSEYNRGWVLETICRQIARHWPASTEFVWTRRNRKFTAAIPPARVYWFSHFQLLLTALEQNPEVRQGRLMVWFTHPSKPEISMEELVAGLNQCHAVIFTCSLHRDAMLAEGVRPEIAHVVLGAADPEVFKPLPGIERDCIGFVSAYYERKRPELMEALIRAMPEKKFLLVGPTPDSMGKTDRMWTQYPHFDRLRALPNLEYIEADYADYPRHYARMTHYLSTSDLEGGPLSAIEGLFCGCQVVLSDTGFARDLAAVADGVEVVGLEAEAEEWVKAISTEGEGPTANIENLSWREFARTLHRLSKAS